MLSFDAFGSSEKPGSSVTWWCRSVNRTVSGSVSGYRSLRAIAISPASLQVKLIRALSAGLVGSLVAAASGRRDLDDDVAAHDRLAAQPRMERQPLGGVQPVLFVLLHLREVLRRRPDDHVARRAGALATAVVLQVDVVPERDVQDRAGQAVLLQWELGRVHLDRDVHGQERDLVDRHHFRSEEHTSELQSHSDLVCRLLLEKKKKKHPTSSRAHALRLSLHCAPRHL